MNRAELSRWFFEMHLTGERAGEVEYVLRGRVSGHPRLPDGIKVHTTAVEEIQPEDPQGRGYLVRTANTLYRIHMAQCDYGRCRALWEQICSGSSCPEWLRLWMEQLPDFARQYGAPGWEDIGAPDDGMERAFRLLDWWMEHRGTSVCLNGLVLKHGQLMDGSELGAVPVSHMEEEPAGTFMVHIDGGHCRVGLGDLRKDREYETLECLRTLGSDHQLLMEELLFWRGIQRQGAEQSLPPGAFLLEFAGGRCFRASYKAANGSFCLGTVELWGEVSGNYLSVRAECGERVSELVFTVKPFSPLRCEAWSPDIHDFCVRCRGDTPLRLQIEGRQVLCPPEKETWIPLPPQGREAEIFKRKFKMEDEVMSIPLFGRFPDEISSEVAEKAKRMLCKIYQTGGLYARVPAKDDPELTVLEPWAGQNEAVLPHSKKIIAVPFQTEQNGHLEGFIYCADGCSEDRQVTRTMAAAALLCEYLFPGIYADLDLKEKAGQETLRFLKGLFPDEDFDPVLSRRMDDRAILEAVKATEQREPYYAYDTLALQPSPAAILEALFVLRSKIEDPANDELILQPGTAFKLDTQMPYTNSESVGLTFFLICLRRALLGMGHLDFCNDKERAVIQAAMLLNRIRNGGREEPESLQLPEQVRLRLFTEEWEMVVQLLAFMAELPAEEVRRLTARTVFQRGEKARMQLHSALRRDRLAVLTEACREPITPLEYLGRHFTPCRYKNLFKETTDSSRCRGLTPQARIQMCGQILRAMGESELYVSERFAHEVLANGLKADRCHAVLLVVELLAKKTDGGFDREKALEILDEADGWLW